jgi:Spy/CpxP family protein refolding chaperone
MGAVAVAALCAAVSFGRPAAADPGQDTQGQGQNQSAQDQSQSQGNQNAQEQGQSQNNRDRRWEKRFEKFSKALNLTDEQQEKIKPLFQNEQQQVEAVRGDKSLSRRERTEKLNEIHTTTREQVQSFLTPEQVEKWNQFKEEAGERRERGQARNGQDGSWWMHGARHPSMTWQERFQQFSTNLSLTEDQKEKIQPLFQDEDQQITAVYDDATVSPTDKPEKVKAIRAATEEKIESVLTPEQMEKWGAWKQQNREQEQEYAERAQQNRQTAQDQSQWRTHRYNLHGGNWRQQFDRLNKAVNLTSEQQEKIKPLFQDEDRQIQTVKKDKSMSKPARQAAIQDVEKATWSQVQSYLTPEQLDKLGMKPEPKPVNTEDQKAQTGDQTQSQQPGDPAEGQKDKDKGDDK